MKKGLPKGEGNYIAYTNAGRYQAWFDGKEFARPANMAEGFELIVYGWKNF